MIRVWRARMIGCLAPAKRALIFGSSEATFSNLPQKEPPFAPPKLLSTCIVNFSFAFISILTMAAKNSIQTSPEKATDIVQQIDDADDGMVKLSDTVVDAAAKGQAASGYETLTPWETVKTFKICSLVCFAMAFSAATDGYQIG
jgi:hypothetical protein